MSIAVSYPHPAALKCRSLFRAAAFFIGLAMAVATGTSQAGEFFSIKKVEWHKKEPRKGPAVFLETPILDKYGKPTQKKARTFQPCLEVIVRTAEKFKASSTYAKAYFYGRDGKLIELVGKPTPVLRSKGTHKMFAAPSFYPEDADESLFFKIPEKVLKHPGEWTSLVVFGDQHGADAKALPSSSMIESFDFAEKQLYKDRLKPVERRVFMNPLVERVIKTNVPEQPQITIFLRPPIGMTDASEAQGVLAMCMIADSVEEIKRRLQTADSADDVGGVLRFAEKHKLIILCWGSRAVREAGTTWDEVAKKKNEEMEKTFDKIADKWEQGVDSLVKEYNIPDGQFLLWGTSDAGQYAGRLALRKPDKFLAVSIHIPNGFDAPRPEANRVLWCLTTGELDFCYTRSLRFFWTAREMGYPIVYKAIVGLGHGWHPQADQIGLKFLEYALTFKDRRIAYEEQLKDPFAQRTIGAPTTPSNQPWCAEFASPAFVGDVVNQEYFPGSQAEMVPKGFRTSLPTQELADLWSGK